MALAYREIYENEVKERENLEKDLYFLGFVLLENELKSDSLVQLDCCESYMMHRDARDVMLCL